MVVIPNFVDVELFKPERDPRIRGGRELERGAGAASGYRLSSFCSKKGP